MKTAKIWDFLPMTAYSVFARKYRPATFEEVIGQEHITTTLKNSISQGRISQAYMFAGPRGVGKTSMARILAKALNCVNGPTVTPCGKCEMCMLIYEGNDQDVIEIDAASNRMVEDARQLRDSIRYVPLRSRFRIYIIDETHMLTRESFNTLLKTLEEPPPRAKFIFATTELHKVPDTIVSRCQLFEFKRLKSREIAKCLEQIVAKESIKIESPAVQLIARNSQGSMRDAESMLDQLASYSNEIKESDVIRITGRTSLESAQKLFAAIKDKSPKGVLEALDAIFKQGSNPTVIADQLIELARGILVANSTPLFREVLEDLSHDELDFCREYAKDFSTESILYIMQILFEARRRIRDGLSPEVVLEVAFVKMTRVSDLLPISEILEQLKKGEVAISQSDDVASRWPLFIQEAKSRINLLVGTLLKESRIVKVDGSTLVLSVPAEIAGRYSDERAKAGIKAAEDMTPEFFGRKLSLVFVNSKPSARAAPVTTESDPSVKKVMEKFAGSRVIKRGE